MVVFGNTMLRRIFASREEEAIGRCRCKKERFIIFRLLFTKHADHSGHTV
jgi:hypothetical protein